MANRNLLKKMHHICMWMFNTNKKHNNKKIKNTKHVNKTFIKNKKNTFYIYDFRQPG